MLENKPLQLYLIKDKFEELFNSNYIVLKEFIKTNKKLRYYTGFVFICHDPQEDYSILIRLKDGMLDSLDSPAISYQERNFDDYYFCVNDSLYFNTKTEELNFPLEHGNYICLENKIILSTNTDERGIVWYKLLDSNGIVTIPWFDQFVFNSSLEYDIFYKIYRQFSDMHFDITKINSLKAFYEKNNIELVEPSKITVGELMKNCRTVAKNLLDGKISIEDLIGYGLC